MDTPEPAAYGAVNYDPWGKPRIGDWIQTYTGKKFHLLDPRPGDFDICDIAHALANVCRFTGHVDRFYSVAEHSVRVAKYLESQGYVRDVCYTGLLHDATEAYICDMARPFKNLPEFKFYRDLERNLEGHIAVALNFIFPLPASVKHADEILLGTEARDLMGKPIDGWHFRYKHLPKRIRPWSPRKAERRFMDMYYKLNPFGFRKPRRFSFGPNFHWRAA